MKTKVVKALLFYDNHLLLLERSGKLFHGMEDLPGGKLEPNELPVPGLIREIKEETGLDVNELIPIATHKWKGPDGRQFLEYFYCAVVDINDVVLNPEEHSSFRWVALEQIESSKIHPKN